jgi:hypothetical protein
MTWFRTASAGRLRARIALFVAVVAGAGVLTGCGSNSASTTTSSTVQLATDAKVAPVALHLNQGSYSVSVPETIISGAVSKGASVRVNGHAVAVNSGRLRNKLGLHIGDNPVEVEATMGSRAPAKTIIHIIRHHSAVEREALTRAHALRAEARRRHEAEARERKERELLKKRELLQERAQQQQATCPNGTYENSAGNIVCKPYESPTQPTGATAQCEDGTYSFSESRSGTCSHHGGVARWLNE